MINSFRGDYYFLSNFYNAPVTFDGITYMNNEAAFQAQKTLDIEERKAFSSLPPNLAKRKGRRVKLRDDWEDVKFDLMYQICFNKFYQNPELGIALLSTGSEYLEEGNTWRDRIWGTYNGIGQNNLGNILMRIRSELGGYPINTMERKLKL